MARIIKINKITSGSQFRTLGGTGGGNQVPGQRKIAGGKIRWAS
jgi:hypothetical protein